MAVRLLISSVVAPLLHTYIYGETPPAGVRLILPVFPPLQITEVLVADEVRLVAGCVIVYEAVTEQPTVLLAVTV